MDLKIQQAQALMQTQARTEVTQSDDTFIDKLKLNVRSLIASAEGNCKDLLDLCIDVIYHNNMKAFGLHQLVLLYIKWEKETEEAKTSEEGQTEAENAI